MDKRFNIHILYKESDKSYYVLNGNVLSHIEDLIIEKVLYKYNIIVKSKWSFLLAFGISSFNRFNRENVMLTDPSTVRENMAKYCVATIYQDVLERRIESEGINKAIIQLIFDGLEVFFRENFKKVKVEDIDDLYNNLDFNYINQLCNESDRYVEKMKLVVDPSSIQA